MWFTFVHAMPYDNARRLQQLLREDRIKVLDFKEIQHNEYGFVILRPGQQIHADFLIEATGLEHAVSHIPSPLLKCLLLLKMLEEHSFGGVSLD